MFGAARRESFATFPSPFPSSGAPMPQAALYRLPGGPATTEVHEAPLRLAVAAAPEMRAQALAIVQVWCPAPHRVDALGRPPAGGLDAVLLWWGASGGAPDAVAQARAVGGPLIALCEGGPSDQAAALDAGADAACGLPVQPGLLRALVVAYRRTAARSAPTASRTGAPVVAAEGPGAAGPIRLDRRAHTCTVAGHRLELTLKEFDLLAYFLDHAGACCSRDEVLERVWGLDFDPGSNSVDVYVYTLRRKLRALGFAGVIQTVRGVGYRLVPPTGAAQPQTTSPR